MSRKAMRRYVIRYGKNIGDALMNREDGCYETGRIVANSLARWSRKKPARKSRLFGFQLFVSAAD